MLSLNGIRSITLHSMTLMSIGLMILLLLTGHILILFHRIMMEIFWCQAGTSTKSQKLIVPTAQLPGDSAEREMILHLLVTH